MNLHYWVHHTGTHLGNTGVQRVVRSLASALVAAGHSLVPVRWCDSQAAIVLAEPAWLEGLARFGGPRLPADPAAGTPLHLAPDAARLAGAWLLLPEVPHVAGPDAPNLPIALDYARYHRLRSAALFYDLIPLRRPGYEAMAAAHDGYARALVAADLVLGISRAATADLDRWWAEQGYEPHRLPRLSPLPLPAEMLGRPRVTAGAPPPAPPIRFVAVGTVEPRKNQLALMAAFARLCTRRPTLELRLDVVGGLHDAVAGAATAIAAAEPRITLHGYLPDAATAALVEAAHATAFVSLDEGFGLPVAESLWSGKPCLCSDHGAVAEFAADGGCLLVAATDPAAIEAGLERLADDPALRRRLTEAARTRTLRGWADYAAAVGHALAAAPPVARLVVLEGSRGGGAPVVAALRAAGVAIARLHWRPDAAALAPFAATAAEVDVAGLLRDGWAVLPYGTAATPAEADEVMATARGLGLQVALEADATVPPELFAGADLVLFADAPARDAALTAALARLPRTVTLRSRLAVGHGRAALPAIAERSPRLAAAQPLRWPRRVFVGAGAPGSSAWRATLTAAADRLGIDVVAVRWDAAGDSLVAAATARGDAAPAAAVTLTVSDPPGAAPSAADPASTEAPRLPARPGDWLLLSGEEVPPTRAAARLGLRVARWCGEPGPATPDGPPVEAVPWIGIHLALTPGWPSAAALIRHLGRSPGRPPVVPCPAEDDEGRATAALTALARAGTAPGWPLPAIAGRRPLLTCAITTYNRAPWLAHSLPRLLQAARPWRDVVEVVVCDNASTDATPSVVALHALEPGFAAHRNAANVGMLGNLGATARLARGAFVWLLGDDDLLLDGAIENILEGLARHPDVEMAYLNYATTRLDAPDGPADTSAIVAGAVPIAPGGGNRRVDALRELAALNENLFTAIYACVFRRDHALRAYQLDTRGPPFGSLASCVPSTVYALEALQDRPAWWVGEPAVVVNMNVSWLRWEMLWHLERRQEMFEQAELRGVDAAALDLYRMQHLQDAERCVRAILADAEVAARGGFDLGRLLERAKHLERFRTVHVPGVRQGYAAAYAAGRAGAGEVPPGTLFARYGLR